MCDGFGSVPVGVEPTRRTMAQTFLTPRNAIRGRISHGETQDPFRAGFTISVPLTASIRPFASGLDVPRYVRTIPPALASVSLAPIVRAVTRDSRLCTALEASCIPCCSENNAVVLAGRPPYVRTFDADPSQGLLVYVRFGPERTVDGTETKEL
jgi:hypothetical protein